jgi:hypothetical protein
MTPDITIDEKKATPPQAPSEDLSRAIEQSVERQPDEQVRSVRLFDNFYRCNWWVQDKTPHPFWLTTGKIRKSSFLRVTKAAEGLLIETVSDQP